MKIAPKYTSDDWKALNLDNKENDWQKAIDILHSRLYGRYIEPIDILIEAEKEENPQDKKFGFTILAIDLLLMETLQAFKEALIDTTGKSKPTFKNFLKDSPYFSKFFPDDSSREKFYKEFRCGILHQAEVQGSTLVWSIGELYECAGDISIINRTEVHENLKKDLDDYINLLRDSEQKELRKLFRKKMDAVANRESLSSC